MSLADTVDQIRLYVRLSKAAERARIALKNGLVAFARVHLTAWRPDMDQKEREKEAVKALRVVSALLDGKPPGDEDAALIVVMADFVLDVKPAYDKLCERERENERMARKLAKTLPAWQRLSPLVKGFSEWGLAVLVSECGDLVGYSGVQKVYKRLGLAPDEKYPIGEKSTGRKIPRNTRGRIMGIIAASLFQHQWRGEKEVRDDDGNHAVLENHCRHEPVVVPAHPIGPYGEVYAVAKARRLARIDAGEIDPKSGEPFPRAWADKGARRAMVKALIHDVWCAWHEVPLHYATDDWRAGVHHVVRDIQQRPDHPSPPFNSPRAAAE